MFKNWQQEKATAALINEAQAVADRLQAAKPHMVDGLAAVAQFWAVSYHAGGQDLRDLSLWKPEEIRRFTSGAMTKIAALRKQRHYDSSDGLAVWLHTARAVTEPRIAPAVREIWQKLSEAGSNCDAMAEDMLTDAGISTGQPRCFPIGFSTQ
jgi:hypothetical protein